MTKQNTGKHYVIALLREGVARDGFADFKISPMLTGEVYTLEEAEAKLKILTEGFTFELKSLKYDRFVVLNLYTWTHKE